MKWKKGTFKYTTNKGKKIEHCGYLSNVFAISREMNFSRGWTMTHLLTGASVSRGFKTLKTAKECAKKLEIFDWGFTEVKDSGPSQKERDEIRKIIREYST